MISNKTPEEIALLIKKIYELQFGGKSHGRFKISRPNFRQLSQRQRLEESTIQRIMDEAFERGFIVTDLGDYFAVVKHSVMMNYRPVPKSILKEFIKDEDLSGLDEDESEE